MKKILIIIMIMVLTYSIPVKAKGETGGGSGQSFGELVQEFDNMGRVKKGEVLVICPTNDGKDEIRVRYVSSDYCFVSYTNSGEKTENGIDIIRYYLRCYDVETLSIDKSYKYDYYWDYYSEGAYDYGNVSKGEEAVSLELGFKPLYVITTSFPVFNEDDENFEENLRKYFEEGDQDAPDYPPVPHPEYDENVELPKNLRTYGKIFNKLTEGSLVEDDYTFNPDIIYSSSQHGTTLKLLWDTPENGKLQSYSYDVRFNIQYRENKATISTAWYDIATQYPYDAHQYVDIDTGQDVPRTSDISEQIDIKESYFNELGFTWKNGAWVINNHLTNIKSVTIQVRNICDGKCSNWVTINSLGQTGYNSTTVQDNDGNTVDDDYYHGQDTSNNNLDKYYENDDGTHGENSSTGITDFNSLMSYIRGGFGLLGNYGIIALMSKTFLYLPDSIWVMLKFFVAMMVSIALIKLVKDVIL